MNSSLVNDAILGDRLDLKDAILRANRKLTREGYFESVAVGKRMSEQCPIFQFECGPTQTCMSFSVICNHQTNCPDASDEQGCGYSPTEDG